LTCCAGIHGYTVNERLFTEPVNVDGDGNSICPSCTRSRKEPTPESPGFVRYLRFIPVTVIKFRCGYVWNRKRYSMYINYFMILFSPSVP